MHYKYLDVAALLDGTLTMPTPDLCLRSDGIGLFYRGQYNVLIGDPECGKTLLTDHATAEELRHHGRVLRLDLDHNGPQATISRLVAFGAPVDALRDDRQFLYVEPEDRIHLSLIVAHMKEWQPTMIVLDSIGELIPMFGGNSNSGDDFTQCHTKVIKPLAATGAAVIGIDHLSKGSDSRSYGATGTIAKKRATGGTSIRVKIDVPFTPGKGGSAYLALNKDRHGGLRQHCPHGDKEPLIGKFVLHMTRDGLEAKVLAAKSHDRNPDEEVPEADIAAIDALATPPKSAREVKTTLHWADGRARRAFKLWKEQKAKDSSDDEDADGGNVLQFPGTGED